MIRSTFAAFTTAQLALQNSQKALDVTGQNIANINTLGYTRQRLDLVSLNFKNGNFANSSNDAQIGFGAEVIGISQIRDPFLDVQYRNQASKIGYTDSKAAILERLSTVLDETDKVALKAAFENLDSQIKKYSLTDNVGKKEFDTMVRSACENLVNLFHTYANDITSQKAEDASELETNSIPSLNEMLENITTLNEQIKNSQILGNPALELMDERNRLLDELSAELPIKVKYKDVEISPGFKIQELQVDLVTDSGNKPLIDDSKAGKFDITVNADSSVNIGFIPAGGAAADKITDIQDHIANGAIKGTADMLNESGGLLSGSPTDEKGYGFYQASLDCLVNVFADTMNALNKDAAGNPAPLFTVTDPTKPLSASNIQVNNKWINGEIHLQTGLDPAGGLSTDNTNLLKLSEALSKSYHFKYTPAGGSEIDLGFEGDFYSCFTNVENELGLDKSATTTLLKTQLSVCQQISNSRDQVSSVQLDEEGISMMHYSQSYNAAARLMTTLDEMLDKLINGTGTVGR